MDAIIGERGVSSGLLTLPRGGSRSEGGAKRPWPWWVVYTLAVLGTGGVLIVPSTLGLTSGYPPIVMLFLLPITWSAYAGGLGPGLTSTGLAVLLSSHFFLSPLHTLALTTPLHQMQWVTLLVTGVTVSMLAASLHRARRHAEVGRQSHAVVLASEHTALQERLSHIVATAPGAICVLRQEPDGTFSFPYASPAIYDIYGLQPESLVEKAAAAFALLHPDDRERMHMTLATSARTMSPWNHQFRVLNPVKGELWVEGHAVPTAEPDGAVLWYGFFMDITLRKQTEERLRLVIESIPNGVLMVNQQGIIHLANRQIEQTFGYTHEEVIGAPVEMLVPEALRTWQAIYHGALQAAPAARPMGARRDLYGQRKDGSLFPLEIGLAPLHLEHTTYVLATVVDITVRKQMEASLHGQAHILGLAQVLVLDMECRIVLWGPGAEKLYGFTRAEAVGQVSHELLRTEFVTPLQDIHAQLHRTGSWEGEMVHHKRDGQAVVIAGLWVVHYDAVGQPSRILATYTDITARKRAEDEVRIAQSRLQTALEAGRMGTWTWDIAQEAIWADEATIKLFGYMRDERTSVGLDAFLTILHPDDRAHVQAALNATQHEGQDYEVEYRINRPDGTMLWIASRGRVEHDVHGHPQRVLGVCADITARKRTEASLQQAQKMEALGTLAGGIAHDFNNILSAIIGNTELAVEDMPPDHPVQRRLAAIDKASMRAADLVRRILTFSRQHEVTRALIALPPVVEEALQLLRATLPAMITIRSRYGPDVPAVSADATQIHQIVMNLGTNAAHAIGEGCGEIDVSVQEVDVDDAVARTVAPLQAGPYVRLSVRDNGKGIAPDELSRIFEPFFTTKPQGEGTGLGLSVIHGIMQQHDGAITVESQLGKGTVFHCYFPAAVSATAVREQPLPPETPR